MLIGSFLIILVLQEKKTKKNKKKYRISHCFKKISCSTPFVLVNIFVCKSKGKLRNSNQLFEIFITFEDKTGDSTYKYEFSYLQRCVQTNFITRVSHLLSAPTVTKVIVQKIIWS